MPVLADVASLLAVSVSGATTKLTPSTLVDTLYLVT
jgi:hypothetical protein